MVQAQRKILKILSKPRKELCFQGQVQTAIYNNQETNDETKINNHNYSFFSYLYQEAVIKLIKKKGCNKRYVQN